MRKNLSNDHFVSRTFKYLLPLVSPPEKLTKEYCIDAYCGDREHPELQNHVFLLFEFCSDPVDVKIETILTGNTNYQCHYHVSENYIMYVLKIPDCFSKDYAIFLKSQYSKMSENAKKAIKTFHKCAPNTRMYGILYKTELRKKALEEELSVFDVNGNLLSGVVIPDDIEYDSLIDLEQEIFNINSMLKINVL